MSSRSSGSVMGLRGGGMLNMMASLWVCLVGVVGGLWGGVSSSASSMGSGRYWESSTS